MTEAVSGIKVIHPGFQTLLQDRGRLGFAHLGLSQGGPADEHAFLWANYLLGNQENVTTVEIALGQAVFEAQQPLTIAITGAEMAVTRNDTPISNWSTHQLLPGDILQFQPARQGNYSYLAVAGGFTIQKTLGSTATVVRNSLGGLHGCALQAGDTLPVNAKQPDINRQVPWRYIPDYREELLLPLLESYQHHLFSEQWKQDFYQRTFVVSPRFDRMGCQLEGEPLPHSLDEQPSEGIAAGAVQIPAHGLPVILLRDRQTIGGYPKIGCLTRRAISTIAQRKPGDELRFVKADHQLALDEWVKYENFFTPSLGCVDN